MAVINLGPSRWSRLGSQFGQGISLGLLNAIEQAWQERLRKQRIQQQYQDLQNLQQALQRYREGQQTLADNNVSQGRISLQQLIQNYQPQTKYGMELAQNLIKQQMQPKQRPKYKRGEPFTDSQGRRVVWLYDQYGQPVEKRILGRAKQKPVTFSKIEKGRVLTKKAVPGTKQAQRLIDQGFVQGRYEDLPGAEEKETDPWIVKKRQLEVLESRARRILGDYKKAQSDVVAMLQAYQVGNATPEQLKQAMDSAYAILSRQAEQGDRKARNDLAKLKNLRKRMDKIVGLDQVEAEPIYNKNDPLGLFQ